MHRICLNTFTKTNRQLLIATQWLLCFNLKNARGSQKLQKRCMDALYAQLCPLRMHDQLENLTNSSLLIVTFMLQTLKMQGEAKNCKKKRFGALCAWLCALHVRDQLENLTNCLLLISTQSDFYATLKMQWEARNRKKKRFRARLCALRAQDQLENLTNCPLLIATHSDFCASTLKNARGSQKSRKEAFWRASRAIVRTARAGSAWKFDQLSTTYCYT